MDAQALVKEAMEQLGVTSAAELADALEMRGRYDHEKIKKWIKGDSKPNYDATITLLRVTNRLQDPATNGHAPTARRAKRSAAAENPEVAAALAELRQLFLDAQALISHLAEVAASPDSARWLEQSRAGRSREPLAP